MREVHTKKSREGARYSGYRRERLNEVSRYMKLQKYWACGYVSYRATCLEVVPRMQDQIRSWRGLSGHNSQFHGLPILIYTYLHTCENSYILCLDPRLMVISIARFGYI